VRSLRYCRGTPKFLGDAPRPFTLICDLGEGDELDLEDLSLAATVL
jgi:hypothetical protein